jgi:hypothetical protein
MLFPASAFTRPRAFRRYHWRGKTPYYSNSGIVIFFTSEYDGRPQRMAEIDVPEKVLEQTGVFNAHSSSDEANPPNDTVVDQIERLLRERENSEAAAAAQMPPDKPRTHRFTNQPIARVLRILAEQAGVNYIEPNVPAEERISVTLTNPTPIQAFYQISQSRGFQVVNDGQQYTLRRSDIDNPSFYATRRYVVRNQPAEFLLQPIANFLGIKVNQAAPNFPA